MNEHDVALARELAQFLEELGATKPVALDVSDNSSFANCLVLAGAESQAQLRGYYRRVHEEIEQRGLQARGSAKRSDESGWLIVDLATVIVHLMLREQREFYDLERLWYDAQRLHPPPQA